MDIKWIMLVSMLVSAQHPNQQYHAFTGVGVEFNSFQTCMDYLYNPKNVKAITGTLTHEYGDRKIHNIICIDINQVNVRKSDPKLNIGNPPGIAI